MMIKPHDKKACKFPCPQTGFELKNITKQCNVMMGAPKNGCNASSILYVPVLQHISYIQWPYKRFSL